MKKLGRDAARDLLILGFVAGNADAAGFMGAGHVFTSNMTGNLVLGGIACGQGQWREALRPLYVILLFMAGVILGSRLARPFPDAAWRRLQARLLAGEAACLLCFAALQGMIPVSDGALRFYGLTAFLAVAMGLQSAVMNRLTVAGVTNTAVTGTLTNLAVGLEALCFGAAREMADIQGRVKMQVLVVLLYCAGAAVNGLICFHAGWATGILPAALISWVALVHRGGKTA